MKHPYTVDCTCKHCTRECARREEQSIISGSLYTCWNEDPFESAAVQWLKYYTERKTQS